MNAPLIDSVVVVLREVLEFALLVDILLAASARAGLTGRWLQAGVAAGLAGATAFMMAMRPVSEWFGGVGYELANAALHIVIYGLLLGCIALLANRHRRRHDARGVRDPAVPDRLCRTTAGPARPAAGQPAGRRCRFPRMPSSTAKSSPTV